MDRVVGQRQSNRLNVFVDILHRIESVMIIKIIYHGHKITSLAKLEVHSRNLAGVLQLALLQPLQDVHSAARCDL